MFWLGINYKETDGTWVYNSDGQTITWSNWHHGNDQGYNGSSQNCVWVYSAFGLWVDDLCTQSVYFICEF